MSQEEVLNYMKEQKKPLTATEIAVETDSNRYAISKALKQMARYGEILKTKKEVWYGNRMRIVNHYEIHTIQKEVKQNGNAE